MLALALKVVQGMLGRRYGYWDSGRIVKGYLFILCLVLGAYSSYAQSKLNITSKIPSSIGLCGAEETLEIDVRNITTSTVTSNAIELTFPTGMYYVSGSVSGTGVSEKSVSNPGKPEFNLPDLPVTGNVKFQVKIIADCNLEAFLTNGGIPSVTAKATYSGGTASHKSLPLTVNLPSINISSITRQYYNADLGEVFVRAITIKNSGTGGIRSFRLSQTFETGLSVVGIRGGSTSSSGNVYTTLFDTSHFKQIGDKDVFFSKDEEIIVYDTIRVKECTKLGASIKLDWGCNGQTCKTLSYSTNVSLKNKAPELVFTSSSNNSLCFDPTIPSEQFLTIVNAGDDTARTVEVEIYQSTNGSGFTKNVHSAFDTSSVVYRLGKSGSAIKPKFASVITTSNSSYFSCLGNNPIGYMRLELPSMLAGDTIYISWDNYSCAMTDCISGFYSNYWIYEASYEDQCGKELTKTRTWGGTGYRHSFSMTSFTPTDINPGDTAKFVYTITNGYFSAINNNSLLNVYFALPSGASHSLKAEDLQFVSIDGKTWKPSSIAMAGDSVKATFKGKPTITLPRSELIIKIVGKCSGNSANQNLNYGVHVTFTPTTTCSNPPEFRIACMTGKIRVHCNTSCSGGLKFGDFDAYRISYGQPDNDNNGEPDASGSLDMDRIKLERVMYGDTLLTVFRGRINRYGSTTTWTRLTASSAIPYGNYLTVADATIRIFRSGVQLYRCNQLSSSYSQVGSIRTFNFDLGVSSLISAGCPLFSGFRYQSSDSVELLVKYVVSTNPGNFLREVEVQNEFYLHTAANPTTSQRYQCDTFSGKFVLAGSYFTNYGRGVYQRSGCDAFEVSQNYYLSVGACCTNYAGGNLFPFEYRKWAKPDKLILIPPQGYEVLNTRLYHYRTTGTGSTAYQYVDSVNLTSTNGDTLFYDISGLFTGSSPKLSVSDDGFYGVWRCMLRPSCKSRKGTWLVQYGFEFENLDYLGTGTERVFTTTNNDEVAYSPPDMDINSLSDDINADSDTAVWQVVVDNAAATANAELVWLAAEDNGNTTVLSIVDLSTNKEIFPSGGIFKLGEFKAGSKKNYLVKAVFSNCDRDSFKLFMGYDCSEYPKDLKTARCTTVYRKLYYTPANTQLESNVTEADTVVDLCSYNPYTVSVRNLGNARAFDLYVDLYLLDGMILRDTAYLFLPGTSDSVMILNPVSYGSGRYRWEISKYSTVLSKYGLAGVTSSEVNSYTLKFDLTTNCDFVSSTYFLARPGGKLRCGKEVLSRYSFSKPIDIKGIVKPYFSHMEFEKKPIDVCNYDGVGRMKFLNLGPDTTGTNDYIKLLLPEGIYLDTTFMTGIHNTPKSKPTVVQGVSYTGVWQIPAGIALGDSVVFLYKTYVNSGELDCGETRILAQSVVSQPALCVKDSSICNIDVSTSSDIMLDSIKKGIYQLKYINAFSIPKNGKEEVSLKYTILNTGSLKEGGIPMTVKIVADSNGNGTFDAGEVLVYGDTIYDSIGTGQLLLRDIIFSVQSSDACNLLLVVDSTSCVCSSTALALAPVTLSNSGPDTIGCSRADLPIGQSAMTGVTYLWKHPGVVDSDSSQTYFNWVNTGSSDSTYKIPLETNRGRCKTTDTVSVTLYPALMFDLPDSIEICAGRGVRIGVFPSGGVGSRSYQWTPTDSLVSPNSATTWAKPTQTTVYTQTVTDGEKCVASDSTKLIVHQLPQARIGFNDTCVGENYTFENKTIKGDAGIDSFAWWFSNGTTFENTQPYYVPDTDDSVTVMLSVTDSNGCSHLVYDTIAPYPLPEPSFTVKDVCQYDTVHATNTSAIKYGTMAYEWKVGATTSNSTDFAYRATGFGDIEIQLTSTSDRGCTSIFLDTITVYEKPQVSVSALSVCLNDTVKIVVTDGLNSSATLDSYNWTINGNPAFSSTGDTSILLSNDGKYDLQVVGTTNNGCLDTSGTKFDVYPLPVAGFTINSACLGDSVEVIDQSTIKSGSIQSLQWNYGNGYMQGKAQAKHYYATFGQHAIGLVVESDHQCFDTIQNSAVVYYREDPNLTVQGHCEGEMINFVFSPVQPDSIAGIEWDIDGTTVTGVTQTSKVFNSYGNIDVDLKLTFVNGCSSDSTFQIVIDEKPLADFNWQLPCLDNRLVLNSTSTTPTTTIAIEDWRLGDGNTATGGNVSHVYATKSNYPVELQVENDPGCRDTAVKLVLIDKIVQPDFIITDICVLDSQWIRERSMDRDANISTMTWDMGDGRVVQSIDSFEYAYSTAGTYNVKMQYTTLPGCEYDTQKAVTIHDLPVAGFTMNPDRADIVNSFVTFTSTSSGAISHRYDFSNGYTTIDADFVYDFPDTGVYDITQTVQNQYGCENRFIDQIRIDFVVHILIPNAFHPDDGNDINNTFSPQGLGIANYDMRIYNRWGEMIYRSENGEAWNGENAMSGGYFYQITIFDLDDKPHYYSGMVYLIR